MSQSHGRGEGRREVLWVERYGDLMQHTSVMVSMPREIANPASDEVAENGLAGWVRYQRRREQRRVMPAWQRHLLTQVPGFFWDPLEDQWEITCAELAQFLTNENRMPRYRTTIESERALAAWVHKQRHLYRREVLPAQRVAALQAMPFRVV